jgi:hypothetical protein
VERETSLAGGPEALIEKGIAGRGDVLRHRFVGDFCVADIGRGENATLVYFVPTTGWCEFDQGFDKVVQRLEVDPKFRWEVFSFIVGAADLLRVLKSGADKYPAASRISKSLRRFYGCDPGSALRLQFAASGWIVTSSFGIFAWLIFQYLHPREKKDLAFGGQGQ